MKWLTTMPVLPKDEQNALAVAAAAGNDAAARRLVESNLRLIMKEAHNPRYYLAPLWDVFIGGVHGMIQAIPNYDPKKGHFSSYAMHWVKMRMRRTVEETRVVKLPQSVQYNVRHDIAGPRTIAAAARAMAVPAVMHEPMFNDGPTPQETLHDEADDPCTAAARAIDPQVAVAAIPRLPDRDRLIITLRFGLDGYRRLTLEEVSKIIGLTRERIRQIQFKALAKLRRYLELPRPQLENL